MINGKINDLRFDQLFWRWEVQCRMGKSNKNGSTNAEHFYFIFELVFQHNLRNFKYFLNNFCDFLCFEIHKKLETLEARIRCL